MVERMSGCGGSGIGLEAHALFEFWAGCKSVVWAAAVVQSAAIVRNRSAMALCGSFDLSIRETPLLLWFLLDFVSLSLSFYPKQADEFTPEGRCCSKETAGPSLRSG